MGRKIKGLSTISPVLLLIFFTLSKVTYAQDEVIRVETNLVTISATVLDREGRYITDLRKEDFQIFEDGIEQELAYFEPTVQPFTALLLLDTSGSMIKQLANLAQAANAFVKQMRPDDQLIVATFSTGKVIRIILEVTRKKDFKQKIVLEARGESAGTTTFNAVERGIKYMENFQRRRAIVLFSDGEMYGEGASAKSNLRDAEEQESSIYTIRFGLPPFVLSKSSGRVRVDEKAKRKYIEGVNAYMQGLAQKTGGRSFHVDEIADLEGTFSTVAEELGQQYGLGYYPKNQAEAGKRRQIKVRVRLPNLVVKARGSYIVRPSE